MNSLTHVHWLPTLKNTPKTVLLWSALLKTCTVTTVEVGLICHYCPFRLTGIFLLHKVYEYKLKSFEQLNTIRTLRLTDYFLEVLETKAADPTKNLLITTQFRFCLYSFVVLVADFNKSADLKSLFSRYGRIQICALLSIVLFLVADTAKVKRARRPPCRRITEFTKAFREYRIKSYSTSNEQTI